MENKIQFIRPSCKHLGTFQAHCQPGRVAQVGHVDEGKMSNIFAHTTRRASTCRVFPIDIQPTFFHVFYIEVLFHFCLQFVTGHCAGLLFPHVYVITHLLHMLFAWCSAHCDFVSVGFRFFLFFPEFGGGCLIAFSLSFCFFIGST